MSALSIGLSGLMTNQRLLNLTGQNINNANTPNYHNEVGNLVEGLPASDSNIAVGSGVQLTSITRSVNQALQEAVTGNASDTGNASTQLNGLNQLQTYLPTGTGSLDDALGNLFTQLEALTTQPGDSTQRQIVVAAANNVAQQLNQTVASINQMQGGLVDQTHTQLDTVNNLTAQIAALNQQIHQGTLGGANVNGLLDQRDQAVSQLAQIIDIRTIPADDGQISVFTNGSPLVLGNQATTLSTATNSQNQILINSSESNQPLTVSGGNLGGDLTLYNTTLPGVLDQLNTLAQGLATQFDKVQSTGLGTSGPMTNLTSQRAVSNVNQPLSAANLAFPPQAGDLYVTVTNLSTGQRTLNKIAINPATQSLTQVAAALSAVPNMQAVVNPQTGSLSLLAKPGYGFDFTGNLSSSPDTQNITGTTAATIDGQYTGTTNDTLTYAFSGPGTIGVTPNLTMQVTNSAGSVLGSFNVGQGYTAGTDLTTASGVNIKLGAGTVNAGDTFTVNVAGNPDSANLLGALGLNTFFTGTGAADLQVNSSLLNDPSQLATSTSGQPGDGSNLAKMVALQNQSLLAGGTQTFQKYLENLIGNVGSQTSDMQTNSTAYTALGQQLNDQLQSATGVDTNQALMQLVQYQQAYQMSAQFVSVVNQTVQALLNIQLPVA
jgi:flagellar hook-associated protein 1 FlgK